MIDSEQLVKLIGAAGRVVGLKEILRAGGFGAGRQQDLKRALRELVRQGRLTQDGKRFGVAGGASGKRSGPAWGGRKPDQVRAHLSVGQRSPAGVRPRGGKTFEGIIHHHRDGFAFVKPIVGQDEPQDVFIPREEAQRALDHDRVLVEVLPGRGGRTMGRLVQVISRTRQLVVGTYREGPRGAWVEAREAELGSIRVPRTQLARPGDAVKVRLGVGEALFEEREQLFGEVAGSLGAPEDHSVEVLSVAFAKGFHDEFPPEVMDEADTIALEIAQAEADAPGRRDLRGLPLVTIDGEDARDFDDAIYVETLAKGWRLVVAIADVSHYVTERTAIDVEALRRATSVYLPGRVLPMLPERLSNGICSLRPDVDRLCLVADLRVDASGRTVSSEIYPGVMRSHARCTYTEVHAVLAGETVAGRTHLRPLFEAAQSLAQTLKRMRVERGAIDFDLPERRVELDEKGLPKCMVERDRWESHRLVEECMLAANEAVARFFREQGLPTIHRHHGAPDEERLGVFVGLLQAYGIEVGDGDALTSKELNNVLDRLKGHPEQRALNQLALRSMMQAVYSSKESGHYGLGAADYLHFTSPIRRYPDLLVHRLLKHTFAKGRKHGGHRLEAELDRLEVLAVQCSERERAAMQVEREVHSFYSCLLVKDRVGESFEGTVAGLSDNGFYVELEGLYVEGFVKGEAVYPDFEFDQATYRLVFGNGRVVKVGEKVKVNLVSVNLSRKQIDLGLEAIESRKGASKPSRRAEQPRQRSADRDRTSRRRQARGPMDAKAPRHGPEAKIASGREQRLKPQKLQKIQKREGASDAAQGFDARRVLDRLWKEKGGGKKKQR